MPLPLPYSQTQFYFSNGSLGLFYWDFYSARLFVYWTTCSNSKYLCSTLLIFQQSFFLGILTGLTALSPVVLWYVDLRVPTVPPSLCQLGIRGQKWNSSFCQNDGDHWRDRQGEKVPIHLQRFIELKYFRASLHWIFPYFIIATAPVFNIMVTVSASFLPELQILYLCRINYALNQEASHFPRSSRFKDLLFYIIYSI